MSLLVCCPVAAFLLFFAAFALNGHGWRAAFVQAAVLWGMAVVAVTEILSIFGGLSVVGLTLAWLAVDFGATVYLRRTYGAAPGKGWIHDAGLRSFRGAFSKSAVEGTVFISALIVILALVGLTALLYPPNTTDAVVYHMPRIVNWLHDHSVRFYATQELKQLKMAPWAEYAMLQFHGLSGGDRFDDLVQWFAMLGSLIGVSLIAELLGATLRGQILAALICGTIPQGVLEASGAKNDYVVGFWLVAFTYYLLVFKKEQSWTMVTGIGASLGLACLTKTTALVFAPPLSIAAALLWPRNRPLRLVRYGLAASALALLLNAGHFARNARLFGTPLGPTAEAPPNGFKYANERFGPTVTVSNMLRNVALHLGTPVPAVNRGMEQAIKRTLGIIGENADDPATTWDYTKFGIPEISRHEAVAGNPLDLLLIAAAVAMLLWRWRTPDLWPSRAIALGLTAAFVLFCAVFKWQPWNTRLHLPLFLLWSAVAGTTLTRVWPRIATALLGTVLVFAAGPAAIENQIRPLTGGFSAFRQPRSALYFEDRFDLFQSYNAAAEYAAAQHCRDIGLVTAYEQFEYPLLVLLGDVNGAMGVRDFPVTNASRLYLGPDQPAPCVVICPNCPGGLPGWNSRYGSLKVFDRVAVLSQEGSQAANSCSFSFTGWYAKETGGSMWWRWSAETGEIHIATAHPMEISLDGQVVSAQPPNTVDILVNGSQQEQLAISSKEAAPLKAASLHLHEGENVLAFVSRNKGIKIPPDDRVLAIAIYNLQTRALNGGTCSLEP